MGARCLSCPPPSPAHTHAPLPTPRATCHVPRATRHASPPRPTATTELHSLSLRMDSAPFLPPTREVQWGGHQPTHAHPHALPAALKPHPARLPHRSAPFSPALLSRSCPPPANTQSTRAARCEPRPIPPTPRAYQLPSNPPTPQARMRMDRASLPALSSAAWANATTEPPTTTEWRLPLPNVPAHTKRAVSPGLSQTLSGQLGVGDYHHQSPITTKWRLQLPSTPAHGQRTVSPGLPSQTLPPAEQRGVGNQFEREVWAEQPEHLAGKSAGWGRESRGGEAGGERQEKTCAGRVRGEARTRRRRCAREQGGKTGRRANRQRLPNAATRAR